LGLTKGIGYLIIGALREDRFMSIPYVQITTICNYRCPHCCFSCTKKGEHMTFEVFKKAVEFAKNNGEQLVIGGGEPTLHPQFWDIIGYGLTNGFYASNLWMATNGSQKEIVKRLRDMARDGIMSVAVSTDRFHPPLDPEVKKWFTKGRDDYDTYKNDLRDFHGPITPIKRGRAKTGIDKCCCEGLMIKPNGDIYHCGCPKSIKIGDVWKGIGDWSEAWDICGLTLKKRLKKEKKVSKVVMECIEA